MTEFRKGMRVRFSPKAIAEINKGADGKPIRDPVALPGPNEIFTIKEIVPWTDRNKQEHFDDDAWANLGPSHSAVALKLLEPV